MHKNQESSQNFAAGALVWFFCCIFFLLSLSACNLPVKGEVTTPIPPAIILPSPSLTILPPNPVNPTAALSFSSSTPTPLLFRQNLPLVIFSLSSPNTTVVPSNPVFLIATSSAPFPAAAKAKFSMSSANQLAPEDIFEEVNYLAGGGPGHAVATYLICNNNPYSKPDIEQPSPSYELMEEINLSSCGWQNQENVMITTTYPNGTLDQHTLIASQAMGDLKIYGIVFNFQPTLKDPTGMYTITLTGSKEQLKISFNVKELSSAHVYIEKDSSLFLYKFLPNEKVRLFAYGISAFSGDKPNENRARLIGWQTYQTDSSGRLFIEMPEDHYYVVVGETSGEFHAMPTYFDTRYSQSGIDKIKNSCPGAPPIRLELNKKARVTITTGSSLRVRQSPGIQGKEINKLKEGSVIDILEGPTCTDHLNWWKLKSKDGIIGWSAEGDLKVYNLEPWD